MKKFGLKMVVVMVFVLGIACSITLGYLSNTSTSSNAVVKTQDSIKVEKKVEYMPDVKLMNQALERAKDIFKVRINL